VTGDDVLIEYV